MVISASHWDARSPARDRGRTYFYNIIGNNCLKEDLSIDITMDTCLFLMDSTLSGLENSAGKSAQGHES
jgi:hypothetical protein